MNLQSITVSVRQAGFLRILLIIVIVIAVLFVFDSYRQPEKQLWGKLLISGINAYQLLSARYFPELFTCRYRPTCSQYTIEAINKYGTIRGGWIGLKRIISCRESVAPGTYDPVP